MKCLCLRCGYGWKSTVECPSRCPGCGSAFWDREKGGARVVPNAKAEVVPSAS